MHGRNSRALFRVIIKNNEARTRVEDHARVILAWTSLAEMGNRMGRRVSGWLHPDNDQDDDWPVPRDAVTAEGSTGSAVTSFSRETNRAIAASRVGCRSVCVR